MEENGSPVAIERSPIVKRLWEQFERFYQWSEGLILVLATIGSLVVLGVFLSTQISDARDEKREQRQVTHLNGLAYCEEQGGTTLIDRNGWYDGCIIERSNP